MTSERLSRVGYGRALASPEMRALFIAQLVSVGGTSLAAVAAAGFVPYLLFAADPDIRLSLPLLVLAGACGLYGLGLDARIRDAAPLALFSRTMTVNSAGLMALQGAGFTLAGALAQAVGPGPAIAISGGFGIATVVLLSGHGFRTRSSTTPTLDTEETACLELASARDE